jgi:hypothetical protein
MFRLSEIRREERFGSDRSGLPTTTRERVVHITFRNNTEPGVAVLVTMTLHDRHSDAELLEEARETLRQAIEQAHVELQQSSPEASAPPPETPEAH